MKDCKNCTPALEERLNFLENQIELTNKAVTKHMNQISGEYKKYIKTNIDDFTRSIKPYLDEVGRNDYRFAELESEFAKKMDKMTEDMDTKLERKISKFW